MNLSYILLIPYCSADRISGFGDLQPKDKTRRFGLCGRGRTDYFCSAYPITLLFSIFLSTGKLTGFIRPLSDKITWMHFTGNSARGYGLSDRSHFGDDAGGGDHSFPDGEYLQPRIYERR